MKKFIFATVSVLLAISAYAKDIQELIVTTNPPMSCQNCENKIKKNLRFEKGVKKIETNIPDQRVTIEYDADKTNPANIEEAFHKIGYNVEVIDCDSENTKECPASNSQTACSGNCCQGKAK